MIVQADEYFVHLLGVKCVVLIFQSSMDLFQKISDLDFLAAP